MTSAFTRESEEIRRRLFVTRFNLCYKLADVNFRAELLKSEMSIKIFLDKKEFSFENISSFSKGQKYQLRDCDSAKIMGDILINGWGNNPFWNDVPSAPNAKILLGEKEYNFRNISSWQRLSNVSKNRVRGFAFKLYSIYGNEYIDYQVRLDIPVFYTGEHFVSASFSGVMENNTDNHLRAMMGLFLIQTSFENEGK